MEIAQSTWGGHDHLPLMFTEWLSNADCNAVGIVEKEELVALGCARILENGRTAWLEGLRVHQDHQGKGYAREITSLLFKEAKKLGAKRTRLTTSSNSAIPNHLAKSIGMTCLYTLDVRWVGVLDSFMKITSSSNAVDCTFAEFIQHGRVNSNLITQNVIIYHWYALDLDTPAIEKLNDLDDARFWISNSNNSVDGIGFGFVRTDGTEKEWCTTIYPQTVEALKSILLKEIEFCKDNKIEYMMFQYPETFRDEFSKFVDFSEIEHHNITLALYEGRL